MEEQWMVIGRHCAFANAFFTGSYEECEKWIDRQTPFSWAGFVIRKVVK